MNECALADVVRRQYERWTYPHPIDDLEVWVRDHHEFFDPLVSYRVFWPDREYSPNLDILVAGCGTNQAAVFAFNNRNARVVGIDISEASLAHQQYLKDKHELSNLELLQLPIEELASLGRNFDLIVSTGVLHHMSDPLMGMEALGSCLRRDGVLGVMLYAKYGRIGVEALQSVFRDLRLFQDERSLNLVKEAVGVLSGDHIVQPYLKIAPDLKFDAGLVDTFLHGRERSYTVDECIDLVASAGLVFQGWLNNACYYPEGFIPLSSALYAELAALPETRVWSLMERLNTQNGCHNFIACREDRPKSQYTIDFSGRSFLDYAPVPRIGFRIEANDLVRLDWRIPVRPDQMIFIRRVDGKNTIKEIIARVAMEEKTDAGEFEDFARALFKSLWRLGFMAMSIQRKTS